jgi:hypothetical protein
MHGLLVVIGLLGLVLGAWDPDRWERQREPRDRVIQPAPSDEGRVIVMDGGSGMPSPPPR